MKILRVAIVIIFAVTAIVYAYFNIDERLNTDKTIPVISMEDDVLVVSLDATNKDFLKGVTAFDEKDGDITEKIIVESVSKFTDNGECKVTYAVCDNDNHVATAKRKIRFDGYVSPRFEMSRALCYSLYENIDVSEAIMAKDCIEGDISRNIIITSDDYSGAVAGVFTIDAKVTNSGGDSSAIKLPLIVEDRGLSAPKIELKKYLEYVKVNEKIDFEDYIVEAVDVDDSNLTSRVKIDSNLDIKKPGVYSVHYYVTDSAGEKGHTVLIIVVEE